MSAARRAEQLARYIPAWLPPDQRSAFTERLAAAFDRYRLAHGWRALSDVLVRGRIVGGVAVAFKAGRLDSAWGRRMLARCALRARLRQIDAAGYQRRAYFEELGQAGGLAAGARRQQQAREREPRLRDPRLADHARLVLCGRRSATRRI